jgi:hypothetical protein
LRSSRGADETWEKLGFDAAHGVDEVLIVDPQERRVHWLALRPGGGYHPIEASAVVALGAGEVAPSGSTGRTDRSPENRRRWVGRGDV